MSPPSVTAMCRSRGVATDDDVVLGQRGRASSSHSCIDDEGESRAVAGDAPRAVSAVARRCRCARRRPTASRARPTWTSSVAVTPVARPLPVSADARRARRASASAGTSSDTTAAAAERRATWPRPGHRARRSAQLGVVTPRRMLDDVTPSGSVDGHRRRRPASAGLVVRTAPRAGRTGVKRHSSSRPVGTGSRRRSNDVVRSARDWSGRSSRRCQCGRPRRRARGRLGMLSRRLLPSAAR